MKRFMSCVVCVLSVLFVLSAAARSAEALAVAAASVQNADAKAAGDELVKALKEKLGGEKPKLILVATAIKKDAAGPLLDALAALADKSVLFGTIDRPTLSEQFPLPAQTPTTAVLAFAGATVDVQTAAVPFPDIAKMEFKDKKSETVKPAWAAKLKETGSELAKQFKPGEKGAGRLLVVLGPLANARKEFSGWNFPEGQFVAIGAHDVLGNDIDITGGGTGAVIVHGEVAEGQLAAALVSGPFHAGAAMCRIGFGWTWTDENVPQFLAPAFREAAIAAGPKPLAVLMFNSHANVDARSQRLSDAAKATVTSEFAELQKNVDPKLPVWGFASVVEIGRVMPQEDRATGGVRSVAITILAAGAPQPRAYAKTEAAPPGKDFIATTAALTADECKGKPGETLGDLLGQKIMKAFGDQKPKCVLLVSGRGAPGAQAVYAGLYKHVDKATVSAIGHGVAFSEQQMVPIAAAAFGGDALHVQIVGAEAAPMPENVDPRKKPDKAYLAGVGLGKALQIPKDDNQKLIIVYSPGHVTSSQVVNGLQSVIGKDIPLFGGNTEVYLAGGDTETKGKSLAILLSGKFSLGATVISPHGGENMWSIKGALYQAAKDAGLGAARVALFTGCGNHATTQWGWRLPEYMDAVNTFVRHDIGSWGTLSSGELGESSLAVPPKGFGNSCPVVILGDPKK